VAEPTKRASSFDTLSTAGKASILVGIVGLLSLVYYLSFHSSLAEEIDSEEQRYQVLQGELAAAKQRQKDYVALRRKLTDREEADRQNLRVLPEKPEIAAFLQDLNRLAELSGLEIQLVEPRPEETEQMYVRIPVTLKLQGTYHHVLKFFYNAGLLERAINMENIRLTEPKLKDGEMILQVDVSATTFRRPGPVAPATGTPTPPPQTR